MNESLFEALAVLHYSLRLQQLVSIGGYVRSKRIGFSAVRVNAMRQETHHVGLHAHQSLSDLEFPILQMGHSV